MNDRARHTSDIKKRLALLRSAMKSAGLDVLVVPTSDPHLSEYLPEHWAAREWFSGFTGSAGTLVVAEKAASLWVDSRYWVQAENQLDGTKIAMCRLAGRDAVPYLSWIGENAPKQGVVGMDGYLVSLEQGRQMKQALERKGLTFKTDVDPVAGVWKDRPEMPDGSVFVHGAPYVGFSRAEKLAAIREKMKEKGCQWHLVSTLDDIAWILNLRGSDIDFNPVFISYLMLGIKSATLIVDTKKVPGPVRAELAADGIVLAEYGQIGEQVAALPDGAGFLIDPKRTSLAIAEKLKSTIVCHEAVNPSLLMKSRKHPSEVEHIRKTMADDGAAFCEFQCWFDSHLGKETITELTVSEKIEYFRTRRPHYVQPSFGTIAGFNANAALPHYQATEKAYSVVKGNGLLLIDTGGQYPSGTTDMTRVIAVGNPSAEQKRDFTLVLKGVIALSESRFPASIPAPMIDAIARKPLWACGLDFGHGTGHGVGYFLNVHEGPQAISYHGRPEPQTAMEEGMVTSVEPGIYREGKWGIRIENLVVNRAFATTEFGLFLEFETLTQCPIDTRLIDRSLLNDSEVRWLNSYHEGVRQKLLPLVDENTRSWLIERTEPI